MTHPLQQVGRWTVDGVIGQGDFATVYRVRSEGDVAALKLCTVPNEATIERMNFEVQALQRFDHPSIPALIEHGEEDDKAFIVMSLMPGQTVKHVVDANLLAGRLYGDIDVLQLMYRLLDVLTYVHQEGMVHRDVKDANVLHTLEGASLALIDFGFCKEAGRSVLRSVDSFWRVGAARFSPPTKLANPALADPSHDVFAVGVIAYRMLTGRFPWSVGKGDGVATLKQLQLSQPLEPITEVNSYCLESVSSWVSKVLELEDDRRPTAGDALEEVNGLIQLARTGGGVSQRRAARVKYPVVLRDPIHGDVRITEYEDEVLRTWEIQRLRSIRQLGFTNMVYPGADHSRLAHSVGCLARVEQILRAIEDQEGVRLDPELRLAARLYALTHDVSHIPFGHTLEDELGFFDRHDENTARGERLLLANGSELGAVLKKTEIGRTLIPYLANSQSPSGSTLFTDVVSSIAGADVLDYIDRDAYYCGVDHKIDSAIFRQFRLRTLQDDRKLVSHVSGSYGLRVDREFAVESVLRERYAMFLKVYNHPSKTAAGALLGKALYSAMLPLRGKRAIKEEEIEQVGDELLLDRLGSLNRDAARWAADRLRRRHLPRKVYRGFMLSPQNRNDESYRDRRVWLADQNISDAHGRATLESELAKQAGLEARGVIVYCPPKAPGYQQVEHWVTQTQDSAPARHRGGFGSEVTRRHLGLWVLWVFYAGSGDERSQLRLAKACQDRFQMDNEIEAHPQQGTLF